MLVREVRVCLCNEKQCPSSSAYANISWGADAKLCAMEAGSPGWAASSPEENISCLVSDS